MSCRLYKSRAGNINIETQSRITHPTKTIINEKLGEIELNKNIDFFKPFGFYTKDYSKVVNINIINEFRKDYDSLVSRNEIQTDLKTKILSLEENAVIAAFSKETFFFADIVFEEFLEKGFEPEFISGRMVPWNLRYDKRFSSNGFKSELLMSFDGYPQFFLDDMYGFVGQAIGAYLKKDLKRNEIDICPTVPFKELFDKFYQMGLLTAYK